MAISVINKIKMHDSIIKKTVICLCITMMPVIYAVVFIGELKANAVDEAYINFTTVVGILCIITAAAAVILMYWLNIKIEYLFLVTYLPLGFIYMFIITPNSVPDEYYHFRMSSKYANYIILAADNESGNKNEIRFTDFETKSAHINHNDYYRITVKDFFEKDDSDITYRNVRANVYPIQYLPQIIARALGNLFSSNIILHYYIGRFFSLLFTASVLFYVIKIIPKYKLTVFVISMLPIFLQQSASYSSDGFINSLSLLLIALILREILSNEKIKLSRYIIITIISVLLAPAKYIYSLLVLPMLFIETKKYKNNIDYCVRTFITITLTFVSAYFWFKYMNPLGSTITTTEWESVPFYSNAFIKEYPLQTIDMVIRTTQIKGAWYLSSLFGGYLSGLTLIVEQSLMYAFLLLFAFTMFSNESEPSVTISRNKDILLRLSMAAIIIIIYLGVLYSMMVGYTPRTSDLIEGVQGRYFIPILLPFIIMLKNRFVIYKANTEKAIITAAIILNTLVIFDVIQKTIFPV